MDGQAIPWRDARCETRVSSGFGLRWFHRYQGFTMTEDDETPTNEPATIEPDGGRVIESTMKEVDLTGDGDPDGYRSVHSEVRE